MKYDFDREVSRQGTQASKWERIQTGPDPLHTELTDKCYGENRVLPMWVADMDFVAPQPVVDALVARAQHGMYGYTTATEAYYRAVVRWMERRHAWNIAPEWIVTTPGVVPALNMLVRTFVAPGDKVLVQRPVYYPFFSVVEGNAAELISNSLVYQDGHYHMDFADLEEKAKDPRLKMAILCSPHNPVGRVWTREELIRFGEICIDNRVLIVADEIHADLIYKGYAFTPFARISVEFARHAIVCTAPSKTFNLAGLRTSNIIIADDGLRARFGKAVRSSGLSGLGAFGAVALEAAYNHGEDWLAQVMDYIEANLHFLEDYVARHLPGINLVQPEGTYLVWLDCRGLGLGKWELKQLILNQAGVFLDEGFIFGPEGEGFERINIACPRSILAEALDRIKHAINGANLLWM
jgi:cystathionine beta-lyase